MDSQHAEVPSSHLHRVRCGFLFNHDQLHQIAHSAPIAFELMRHHPHMEVRLLTTTVPQLEYLRCLLERNDLPQDCLTLLELPGALRAVAPAFDRAIPFSRVVSLFANRGHFAELDILVTPEKTSLLLRSIRGLESLKIVHTRHGAGDRGVGFDRHSAEFDFVLMSGEKIRDRLGESGLLKAGGYAIVGYPKFDLLASRPVRGKIFENDLPTVLYNPHCSPRLSSWYEHGAAVIEAFARCKRYNLIFAPHVMLFRKRMQISLSPFRLNFSGSVPRRHLRNPNILIDLGSARSTDMTYTESADLYLGDVSSQVYEFLRRPRPCVFLDAHRTDWRDDPNYRHWHCGPVLRQIDDLIAAVDSAFENHHAYAETQRAQFAYSIDLQDKPSSRRAADAVASFARQALPAVDGIGKLSRLAVAPRH